MAYLENRVVLKVLNLATKQTRTVLPAELNYSYADGDQEYSWSRMGSGSWFGSVTCASSPVRSGSSPPMAREGNQLDKSGFTTAAPTGIDGTMMYWAGTRDGAANYSGSAVTYDIYGMFFTRAAYDRFRLSKSDYTLVKELEEKAKEEKGKAETGKKELKGEPQKELLFELEGIDQRKARFTIASADIAGAALSKSGDKLFYLAQFEKGYDLWQTELRTKETKLLVKLGADEAFLELSKDGKALYVLADGRVSKIDPESGKSESVALGGEVVLQPAAERAYMFDHMWRQIKEKFVVADLYGVDWDYYYKTYQKFLPFINNNYDYAEWSVSCSES